MSASECKLGWIQALRGIAALMAVMVHSRSVLFDSVTGKTVADHLLFPMAMGVDLFFIISGFLMVLTTRNFDETKTYIWTFVAKRIARIWPLFAVVSLVAIAVEHHGLHGYVDRSVLYPYLGGLAFIPHNPGASPIYFQMAVGVAWTLCFECYFYLVFAACMLFGRKRYWAMTAWFALTLIAIPVLRGHYNLGVATQPVITWSRYANLAVNPIVWDFVFGMAAAWLYGSALVVKRKAAIYAVTLTLLAILLATWKSIDMMNFFGPFGWGTPLAILFFGAVMRAKVGNVKVPGWTVWLGEISYSLYLVHVYVFEVVQRIATHISVGHNTLGAILFITRPIMAVVCAWVMFRYIEMPTTTWMRKLLLRIRLPHRQRRSNIMDIAR